MQLLLGRKRIGRDTQLEVPHGLEHTVKCPLDGQPVIRNVKDEPRPPSDDGSDGRRVGLLFAGGRLVWIGERPVGLVGWQLDWVLLDGCEVGLLDYVLGWKPRDQVRLPRAKLDDLRRALTVGSRLDLQIDEVETQHEQVLGTNHPSALIGWR